MKLQWQMQLHFKACKSVPAMTPAERLLLTRVDFLSDMDELKVSVGAGAGDWPPPSMVACNNHMFEHPDVSLPWMLQSSQPAMTRAHCTSTHNVHRAMTAFLIMQEPLQRLATEVALIHLKRDRHIFAGQLTRVRPGHAELQGCLVYMLLGRIRRSSHA